jgi:hypothetical protein
VYRVNTEERTNLNEVAKLERMQNPKKIFRGVENILCSSKELFNRDVTKVRLQNLVMNDELM